MNGSYMWDLDNEADENPPITINEFFEDYGKALVFQSDLKSVGLTAKIIQRGYTWQVISYNNYDYCPEKFYALTSSFISHLHEEEKKEDTYYIEEDKRPNIDVEEAIKLTIGNHDKGLTTDQLIESIPSHTSQLDFYPHSKGNQIKIIQALTNLITKSDIIVGFNDDAKNIYKLPASIKVVEKKAPELKPIKVVKRQIDFD